MENNILSKKNKREFKRITINMLTVVAVVIVSSKLINIFFNNKFNMHVHLLSLRYLFFSLTIPILLAILLKNISRFNLIMLALIYAIVCILISLSL